MKSNDMKWLPLMLAASTLAGCGSFDGVADGGQRPASAANAPVAAAPITSGVRDGAPMLGEAFTVGGVTYTPADVVDYDDVGYASWYGDELAGRPTTNGEIFRPSAISAAHKTLPLPSYVEVTALDTGKTILVRVNDRGPMDNSRLIDLSQGAAQQLGIADRPSAVRVRRVSPPESERVQLRSGQMVPERLATPESLLSILRTKAAALPVPRGAAAVAMPSPVDAAPAPVRTETAPPATSSGDRFIVEGAGDRPARVVPRPAPSSEPAARPTATLGAYVVQVAAYGNKARADAAARKVGGTAVQSGNVWRVRMGPFADEKAAQAALASAKAKGFGEARIMRDR
jgi:rare lipoprotein A